MHSKFTELYHSKIKEVAKISIKIVDECLGLGKGMIRAPAAGDWTTYNTWDNQGELLQTAAL